MLQAVATCTVTRCLPIMMLLSTQRCVLQEPAYCLSAGVSCACWQVHADCDPPCML